MPVMGNGFCPLNAIDLVLYCDYNEMVTVDHMANNILEHLAVNADYYKQSHTDDIIQDTDMCFKFGIYGNSTIDVITIATRKAVHLNLSIYQKGPDGNIQVIEQTTDVMLCMAVLYGS